MFRLQLATLHLGSLPAELGRLPRLNRLLLRYNALTGTLPPELGATSNIKDLYLDGNAFTGRIPPVGPGG